MPLYRRTCEFPGCALGDDGGAYKTKEDLDSEELVFKDMKLHVEICHNVDNGKEWVGQQVELNPLLEGLCIMIDKPGYKEVGIPAPTKVKSIVECGSVNSDLDKMFISPDLAMRLGSRKGECSQWTWVWT